MVCKHWPSLKKAPKSQACLCLSENAVRSLPTVLRRNLSSRLKMATADGGVSEAGGTFTWNLEAGDSWRETSPWLAPYRPGIWRTVAWAGLRTGRGPLPAGPSRTRRTGTEWRGTRMKGTGDCNPWKVGAVKDAEKREWRHIKATEVLRILKMKPWENS